jgi:DoxX-like family
MNADRSKKLMVWTGRVLSAVSILMMLLSAAIKLIRPPEAVDMFVHKFGYPEGDLVLLAVLEIACALLYAIPPTSFLGAVLMTGYLGGAVATHVRVGDPGFLTPLVLGIFTWAGLYLRDPRLRQLIPLRRPDSIA